MSSSERRVVVSGIGVIAPNGAGKDRFWEASLAGKVIAASLPDHWFDYFSPVSKLWAPLPQIDFSGYDINRLERMQLDNVELLSLACACEAIRDAGLQTDVVDEKKNTFTIRNTQPERGGAVMGTGIGGVGSVIASQAAHCGGVVSPVLDILKQTAPDREYIGKIEHVQSLLRTPSRFHPMTVPMSMPGGCSASIGIKYGITGLNQTCTTACAAGTMAIGGAFEAIRAGSCDYAFAGGAEYLADDFGGCFRGFDIAKTLVQKCDDPLKANRPFDRDRSGFLFAEGGGAVLFLEEREHAARRSAHIYAEIAAYAQSFDAYSMMAMEPDCFAAIRMIERALDMARIDKKDIDYINAHGTGTRLNDETESAMIEKVFGNAPLVNSTKSLIGHTIGASGAIEAAVAALSIHDRTTHASKNIENPVRPLNFVVNPGPFRIDYALTQSFAFGGHNACLIFKKFYN